MVNLPQYINLANLPTKIERLERLSNQLGGPEIYIKRDDQTGTEVSGNKIRKLEFSVREALNQGCDTLITCGGLQSNHARATAAAAAKLGLKSVLVLRCNENHSPDGNHLLDKLLGADVRFINGEEYKNSRMDIMEGIKLELETRGQKGYIIPEGASNGIGLFGYFKAMQEIINQESEMGVHFDMIVSAVGSGGTYGGMFLANKLMKNDSKIYGVNVCDDEDYFKNRIYDIIMDGLKYLNTKADISRDEINIIDGYVGRGYAQSRQEELDFIYELARMEGLILDPVYTGKAMYGLCEEIRKGRFKDIKNILFIHTGGLFGLFPFRDMFDF